LANYGIEPIRPHRVEHVSGNLGIGEPSRLATIDLEAEHNLSELTVG
jgi:hypothetical protein